MKSSFYLTMLAVVCFAGSAIADEIGSFEFTGGSLAFTDADAGDGITVSDLNTNSYTTAQLFDGPEGDYIRLDASEAPNGTGTAFKFGQFLSFSITNNSGEDVTLGQFTIDYRGENVVNQFQARVYNAFPFDIVADTIDRLGKPNGGTDDEFATDDAILDGTSAGSGANFFGVPTVVADGATVEFMLPFNTNSDDATSLVDMDNLTLCLTVPEEKEPEANLLATFEFTAGSLSPTDADAADGVTVSDLRINDYTVEQLFDGATNNGGGGDGDMIRLDGLETQNSTGNAYAEGEFFDFDVTNNSGSPLNMDSLRIDYRGNNVFQQFTARVYTAIPEDVVGETIGRLGKDNGGSDPGFLTDIAFLDGTDPGFGELAEAVVVPDGGTVTFFFGFNMNSNSDARFMDMDNLTVNSSIGGDVLVGDVNCDGFINLLDVAPFIDLITNGEFSEKADINGDGFVNLLDVGPFVDLLVGG